MNTTFRIVAFMLSFACLQISVHATDDLDDLIEREQVQHAKKSYTQTALEKVHQIKESTKSFLSKHRRKIAVAGLCFGSFYLWNDVLNRIWEYNWNDLGSSRNQPRDTIHGFQPGEIQPARPNPVIPKPRISNYEPAPLFRLLCKDQYMRNVSPHIANFLLSYEDQNKLINKLMFPDNGQQWVKHICFGQMSAHNLLVCDDGDLWINKYGREYKIVNYVRNRYTEPFDYQGPELFTEINNSMYAIERSRVNYGRSCLRNVVTNETIAEFDGYIYSATNLKIAASRQYFAYLDKWAGVLRIYDSKGQSIVVKSLFGRIIMLESLKNMYCHEWAPSQPMFGYIQRNNVHDNNCTISLYSMTKESPEVPLLTVTETFIGPSPINMAWASDDKLVVSNAQKVAVYSVEKEFKDPRIITTDMLRVKQEDLTFRDVQVNSQRSRMMINCFNNTRQSAILHVCDLNTNRFLRIDPSCKQYFPLQHCSWSSDGNYIVGIAADRKTVIIFDVQRSFESNSNLIPLYGFTMPFNVDFMKWSNNGAHLAVGIFNNTAANYQTDVFVLRFDKLIGLLETMNRSNRLDWTEILLHCAKSNQPFMDRWAYSEDKQHRFLSRGKAILNTMPQAMRELLEPHVLINN